MPEGQIRWYRVLDTHGDYAAVKTYLQGKLTEKYPNFTATEIAGATANHQIIQSYLTDAEVAASPVSLTPSSAGAVKEAYDFSARGQPFDMSRLSKGEGDFEDGIRPNNPDGDDEAPEDTPGIRDYCNPAELIRLRKESTLGSTRTIFYGTYEYDGRGTSTGADYLNARAWKNIYGRVVDGADDLSGYDVIIMDGGTENIARRKWSAVGTVDLEGYGANPGSKLNPPYGGLSPADAGHVTRHPVTSFLGGTLFTFVDGSATWVNTSGDIWEFTATALNMGDWGLKPTSGSLVTGEIDEYTFYEKVTDGTALNATPYSFWHDGTTMKVHDPDGDPEKIGWFGWATNFGFSTDQTNDDPPAAELSKNLWQYVAFHGTNIPTHQGTGASYGPHVLGLYGVKSYLDGLIQPNNGYDGRQAIWIDGCTLMRDSDGYYSAGNTSHAETINTIIRGSYFAHHGDPDEFHGVLLASGDSHQTGGQGVDGLLVVFNRMTRGGRPVNFYGFNIDNIPVLPAHGSDTQRYERDSMYMAHPNCTASVQRMRRMHFIGNVVDNPFIDYGNFGKSNQGVYFPSGDSDIQAYERFENFYDVLIHGNIVQGCDDFCVGFKAGPWDENHAQLPVVSRNLIFAFSSDSIGVEPRGTISAPNFFPNASNKGARWSGKVLNNTIVTTLSAQFFISDAGTDADTTREYDGNVYKGSGKWNGPGGEVTTFANWQAKSSAGYTFDPNGKHIS